MTVLAEMRRELEMMRKRIWRTMLGLWIGSGKRMRGSGKESTGKNGSELVGMTGLRRKVLNKRAKEKVEVRHHTTRLSTHLGGILSRMI